MLNVFELMLSETSIYTCSKTTSIDSVIFIFKRKTKASPDGPTAETFHSSQTIDLKICSHKWDCKVNIKNVPYA